MITYEKLGIRKLINASGTLTLCGGSCTYPEAIEALKLANENFAIVEEVQLRTGEAIAKHFGTEAGLITSGAFSAIVLATAACMMRDTDLDKIASIEPLEWRDDQENTEWLDFERVLPDFWRWENDYPPSYYFGGKAPADVKKIKNEVVIQWCHRNNYDHAYRVAGAKLNYIGNRTDDPYRLVESTCTLEQLDEALTENTAAVTFVAQGGRWKRGIGDPKEICKIAHEHEIPVIADSAGMEPPRANLKKPLEWGADLSTWSAGKGIRAINDTGFLVGRKELINLAHLQGFPHHGIGRGYKVDKASMISAATALEIYLKQDEKAEFEGWDTKVKYMVDELENYIGVASVKRVVGEDPNVPIAEIEIDEKALSKTTMEIRAELKRGKKPIWVQYRRTLHPTKMVLDPRNLKIGEEKIVVQRLKEELKRAQI